jgi:hypothetical protein
VRQSGYYWVKLDAVEDWEPALWTGDHWVLLGTGVRKDEPEVPEVIGDPVTSP